MKTATSTTAVPASASLLEGQVTFFNSVFTSLKNCLTLSNFSLIENSIRSLSLRRRSRVGHSPNRVDGRPGGIRTPITRIWSPVLYPLELLASPFVSGLRFEDRSTLNRIWFRAPRELKDTQPFFSVVLASNLSPQPPARSISSLCARYVFDRTDNISSSPICLEYFAYSSW